MSVQGSADLQTNIHGSSLRFTEQEIRTLAHVCDALIPSIDTTTDPNGLFARRASDLHIAPQIAARVEEVAEAEMIMQLKVFLWSIENPLASLLMAGNPTPFSQLDLHQQTEVLRKWESSRLNLRRKAFQTLKRLAMMFFYSQVDMDDNPNWAGIGYSGPPPRPPETSATTIKPMRIDGDTVLHTDVVIVGSGAGGGVVAGELSAAGYDVVVLEKGGFYTEPDFDGAELSSYARFFENRGLLTTSDLSMLVMAGSALGGGTTINWAASFRTPDNVLEEWEKEYGVTGFTGDAYQDAMEAVSERINVNDSCPPNRLNAILYDGASELGFSTATAPRNARGCEDCGFCNFGCPYGTKQSTLRTYLQDTYDRDGRILVNAHVERVLVTGGQAVGVEGTVVGEDGRHYALQVHAPAVVVAAGALHTPAILMRSGLTNQNIGSNLHLHPTTVSYGVYDEPVRGWEGAAITRVVDQFKNLDGMGYGVTLETAPIHPGLSALSLPWEHGGQHKATMSKMANISNVIVLTRDRFGGRITINKAGYPRIHYDVHRYDANHMMRGLLESIRVQHAAGATEIGTPFSRPLVWYADQNLDEFLQTVARQPLLPNQYIHYSAHQMSSCRMGGTPLRGALRPTGESFEVSGLFVADASALPTATGVNPMLTIMSVAHYIAGHVAAFLN